ncbi:MAG: C1 family peptidase [Pseudomonadota bacterium]
MPFDPSRHRLGGCLFEDSPTPAPQVTTTASSDSFPQYVDLRSMCSPVENQGQVGSCAANAVVGALEFHQRMQKQPLVDLSRLFVYYNSRRLADNEKSDVGTFIHHVMASVMAYGACSEAMWPYIEAMWSTKPTEACYREAMNVQGLTYARADLGPACLAVLAEGLPVVFGACIPGEMIQVEAALTGRIETPQGPWPEPGGGHAMLVVGYDLAQKMWLIRNSWGTDWGDGGHAWVSFDVMSRYGMPSQFWTIGAIQPTQRLMMSGPSVSESVQTVRASAPATARSVLQGMGAFKQGLRTELESNIQRTRSDIRNRLRGPGAGGGY